MNVLDLKNIELEANKVSYFNCFFLFLLIEFYDAMKEYKSQHIQGRCKNNIKNPITAE